MSTILTQDYSILLGSGLLLFGSAVTEVRPAVTDHCYPLYIILIVIFYVLLPLKNKLYTSPF